MSAATGRHMLRLPNWAYGKLFATDPVQMLNHQVQPHAPPPLPAPFGEVIIKGGQMPLPRSRPRPGCATGDRLPIFTMFFAASLW